MHCLWRYGVGITGCKQEQCSKDRCVPGAHVGHENFGLFKRDIVARVEVLYLVDPNGKARRIENHLMFHGHTANFPWISQARWIYSQMIRWGQVTHNEACLPHVDAAYRPDIYRDVLATSATAVPLIDGKLEGAGSGPTVLPTTGSDLILDPHPFIDGRAFDASDISGYVNGFAIRAK